MYAGARLLSDIHISDSGLTGGEESAKEYGERKEQETTHQHAAAGLLIVAGQLWKADVIANGNSNIAVLWPGVSWGDKVAKERKHRLVSSTQKSLPAESVSDSLKVIFPGTSMSKRCILR